MDDDLKDEIERQVRALLTENPATTDTLNVCVDCCEKTELVAVLHDLKKSGVIRSGGSSGKWYLGDSAGTGRSGGVNGKLAPCATAIVDWFNEQDRIATPAEIITALDGQHSAGNVSYHLNALARRGVIKKVGVGKFGPGDCAPANPEQTPADKVSNRKTATQRPRTAAPDSIAPRAVAEGQGETMRDAPHALTYTCPAGGRVEVTGTRRFVFRLAAHLGLLEDVGA